uniref:Uncharacterized protein n=1 Tax=Chelonoidis abingdonii TaxID=106734 RepID=A0A8C0HEJ3_CHEAB
MLKPRTNHASAVLNGEIYVECYDPYNNSWCPISPALKYVSNFTATGCLGKLYLIGSCAIKYNALTLQCYNPVIDMWSVIASPFIPKYLSAPRCASLHGAIYLIGDNTKKVYVYDPDANIWILLRPSMFQYAVQSSSQTVAPGKNWRQSWNSSCVEPYLSVCI